MSLVNYWQNKLTAGNWRVLHCLQEHQPPSQCHAE